MLYKIYKPMVFIFIGLNHEKTLVRSITAVCGGRFSIIDTFLFHFSLYNSVITHIKIHNHKQHVPCVKHKPHCASYSCGITAASVPTDLVWKYTAKPPCKPGLSPTALLSNGHAELGITARK